MYCVISEHTIYIFTILMYRGNLPYLYSVCPCKYIFTKELLGSKSRHLICQCLKIVLLVIDPNSRRHPSMAIVALLFILPTYKANRSVLE